MGGELQTLLAASLTWLIVFLLASLAGSALFRVFRRVVGLTPARQRSGFFLGYALLPALVATAVMTTLYFPGIANLFLPAHCHADDCAPHAPQFAVNAAYGAMTAAMAITLVLMLFYLPLSQLLRHSRKSAILHRLTQPGRQANWQHGFRVVENDAVLAWCDGLIWPRVFVSRGLLDRLDADELKIVLAHERAHAERRDNLARVLIDWSTRLWPGRQRRALHDDFGIAAEHACDHAAAGSGEPGSVARIIGKLGHSHALSNDKIQRIDSSPADAQTPLIAQLAPALFLLALCLVQSYLLRASSAPHTRMVE